MALIALTCPKLGSIVKARLVIKHSLSLDTYLHLKEYKFRLI